MFLNSSVLRCPNGRRRSTLPGHAAAEPHLQPYADAGHRVTGISEVRSDPIPASVRDTSSVDLTRTRTPSTVRRRTGARCRRMSRRATSGRSRSMTTRAVRCCRRRSASRGPGASRSQAPQRSTTPTGRLTCTSVRWLRKAKRATGSRPCRARDGSPSCVCTAARGLLRQELAGRGDRTDRLTFRKERIDFGGLSPSG